MKTNQSILFFSLLSLILISCDLIDSDSNIRLSLNLNKYNYEVNDTLKGTFTIKNLTLSTLSYRFSTGCQFGLNIKKGNTMLKHYPELCTLNLSSLTLESGESKIYEFIYYLVDENYNPLQQGNYIVEGFLLDGNSSVVNKSIKIE